LKLKHITHRDHKFNSCRKRNERKVRRQSRNLSSESLLSFYMEH
jgi:hypothetical protein